MTNMINSSWQRLAYVALLTLLAAGESALAQQPADETAVIYRAAGGTFAGPDRLDAGFVTITLQNDGDDGFELTLYRLNEGAGIDAVLGAVEAIDTAYLHGGNPVEAINEALELIVIVGQLRGEPGTSRSFGATLAAGSYLLIGSAEPLEGGALPPSSHQAVTVSEGEAQRLPPQADVTVTMLDFAFELPPRLSAGEQLWEVVNLGEQVHHLVLFKLREGKSMNDVMAFMETFEGEPPADEAGHVGVISPGGRNYVPFDLTPGDYFAICFLPDHRGEASGEPHVALGMIQAFTVAAD